MKSKLGSGRYIVNAEGNDLNTDGFVWSKECCRLTMEAIQSLSGFCYMLQLCFLMFIQRIIKKAGVRHSQFSCYESAMKNSNQFIITHIREQIRDRK